MVSGIWFPSRRSEDPFKDAKNEGGNRCLLGNQRKTKEWIVQIARGTYPLPPGFDFTNVLRAAFTQKDPKRVKIRWLRHYLFVLLGSSCSQNVGIIDDKNHREEK